MSGTGDRSENPRDDLPIGLRRARSAWVQAPSPCILTKTDTWEAGSLVLSRSVAVAGLAAGILFVALGAVFVTRAGAHYDETLFVRAIYHPDQVACALRLGAVRVPLMLTSYAGTLKSALYTPLFYLFGNTLLTLRIPALIIGGSSVWLFFLGLRRLAGNGIAALLSILLATDVSYLLSVAFDWGPVALQHLLFTGALCAGISYGLEHRVRYLFACSLCAGLALWDKAVFLWLLAGFVLALVLVFPRQSRDMLLDRRRLPVLALGFILGAAPFLYYNKLHRIQTIRAHARLDIAAAWRKIATLNDTLDGSGLYGYLLAEDVRDPGSETRAWEKLSIWMNEELGRPGHSCQHYVLVSGFVLGPALAWAGIWRRPALLLSLGGLFSYIIMITTRGAGASAHHIVLLWPLPHMLTGIGLANVERWCSRRVQRAMVLVVMACAVSNLALLNTYLAGFITTGPSTVWSDAIFPLAEAIKRSPERMVFAADWGVSQQMDFYGAGSIRQYPFADAIVSSLHETQSGEYLRDALADPRTLFITHTEGREAFPGARKQLIVFAAEHGYRDHILNVVHDRHGSGVFEIHEFRRK